MVKLSAGGAHTCAVTPNGAAKCWGLNNRGQIGDGTSGEELKRLVPTQVSNLTSGVATIASGGGHTCAHSWTEQMECWGSNEFGQIGDDRSGSENDRLVPIDVHVDTHFPIAIASGGEHTCAITGKGIPKCWGSAWAGQIGNGTMGLGAFKPFPVAVANITSGTTAIAAGLEHSCALTSAGGVKCWGYNEFGQIGDGFDGLANNRIVPSQVSNLLSGVTAIAAGGFHTCALTSAGAVKCWGDNDYGQIGDGKGGTMANTLVPAQVSNLISGVTAITAGGNHTCALTSAGAVKCWGKNEFGQIGDGTSGYMNNRLVPTQVSGLTSGVVAISAGGAHTCALMSTGTVKCWGLNESGQVGDGTSGNNRLVPTQVVGFP